ncbi:chromosome segregation SMC family protein, partial [Treponema paraluiscuniculi]
MLFLKTLEVFGFKSFADRVRVEFADGVTALLGPNGCGKSNVVDAIKWVLGEQSSRALRADRMEDVIFNGTESRRSLNVAEASLTVCDEAGILSLDVPEILIKRRLYRSGESEYFLNGNAVRLKEIRELFWDTGIGKVAYSVMEQGKIDQILSNKPEERRYLFEEAAGVTRFKVRGAEAARKLEKTAENLRHLEVILQEVEKSYGSSKLQAAQTQRYRMLKEEIFARDRDLGLLRLRGFLENQARADGALQRNRARRDALQTQVEEAQQTLSARIGEINDMEKRVDALQKEIYGLAIEQKAKQNEASLHRKHLSELKESIGQIEMRKIGVESRVQDLEEEVAEQDAHVYQLGSALSSVEEHIESFARSLHVASEHVSENDQTLRDIQGQMQEISAACVELEASLRGVAEDIAAELDTRLSAAGYSARNRAEAERTLVAGVQRLRTFVEGRARIVSDFLVVDTHTEGELCRMLTTVVDAFNEAVKIVHCVEADIAEYARVSARFIDEFVAPQGIMTKKREFERQLEQHHAQLERHAARQRTLQEENKLLVGKIEACRKTLESLRVDQARLRAEAEAGQKQAAGTRGEVARQRTLQEELEGELFTEGERVAALEERLLEIEGEIGQLEQRGVLLTKSLENCEGEIRVRNAAVTSEERALQEARVELAQVGRQLEQAHRELMQCETEIRNLREHFREQHTRDLSEFEDLIPGIEKTASDLRQERGELQARVKEIGAVNFMAVEEFQEVKERYEFLVAQVADLEKARADLQRVTDKIKAESAELFLATYRRIRKNFHEVFRRLFGGGRAEIRLSDPAAVLSCGIEILAQPPGKKLEHIGLLSGGEKAMTAVALLFATYMVKPAPFCLLDEIDAALDEHNVARFVGMLDEFSDVSQYIVITHNRRTVLGARTMLGVTMEEPGVSKVVSIALESASERPANGEARG